MFAAPPPPSTHMQDLQEVTQDLHYENFRSERLKRGGRLSSYGYVLPLSPAYVPSVSALFCSAPPPASQSSQPSRHSGSSIRVLFKMEAK